MKKLPVFLAILFISAGAFAQPVPNSGTVMAAAYKKAAKENKHVFVIFHASWCGWCKKMDASMNDETTKKYFDENYVTVHLDVQEQAADKALENPGADVFLAKYKGEKAGLPFFLVMDKTGKKIGDSFVNNQNIGCPASQNEVASFITLLKSTSKIDEAGLNAISIRFRKNEAK